MLPLAIIRVTWKNHDPAVFGIHRNIFEYCSPFFKVLLASNPEFAGFPIKQAEQAVMRVTELEASIIAFRTYTEWVYSGLIQTKILGVDGLEADDISYHNIGQAYILSERLQDCRFKNAIVDFLLKTIITHGKMDLTLPNLIFDKTSVSSPLRKLLVDIYVWYGHKDWLKPDGSNEGMSTVFLSELLAAFLARNIPDALSTTNVSVLNACKYYEYPEGRPFSSTHPREVDEPKR